MTAALDEAAAPGRQAKDADRRTGEVGGVLAEAELAAVKRADGLLKTGAGRMIYGRG